MDPLQPQDPNDLGDWKIIARLASSTNSNIYLGHRGIEGLEQAAIKVLSEEISGDLNAIDRLRVEAEALKKINNPYIAKLVDYNLESNPVWIATEYIDRKTLDAKLKQDGKPITGQEWWQLAAKIFNGLKAIHSEKIIHKDVKPANIIVSGEQVKIIDFGISYVPGNTGKIDFTAIQFEGSRPFAAPENFNGKDSEKMDVFSAAVTLAYAGKLRSIWNDENESTLRNSVIKEKPDLTGLEPEQIELLEPLLDKFPSKRPSSEEAEKKILQYIEYLVGQSTNKPNPLKGSSLVYRLVRNKTFVAGLIATLILIGGFVLSNQPAKTIYLPNPTPNPTITVSASPQPSSSQNSSKIKSSSVACEDEYVNKGKNVISLCLAPAKTGDSPSIFYLGREYFNNKNYLEAEKWFLIGAKQKDFNSMRYLIETYTQTNNVTERSKWAKICADTSYGQSDKAPLASLAYCKMIQGFILERAGSRKEAILYLKDAADYGESSAALWLGLYYRDIDDETQALKWITRSADLGNKDGIESLITYAAEIGNEELSLKWAINSANDGNPENMGLLATYYFDQKNYSESRKWAKKGSDLGDAASMGIYGQIIYEIDKNEKEGKSWIIKGANKGNIRAMRKIGEILRIKENNFKDALTWYEKLALRNDLLGNYYSAILIWIQEVDTQKSCKYIDNVLTISDKQKAAGSYDNVYDNTITAALDWKNKTCLKE